MTRTTQQKLEYIKDEILMLRYVGGKMGKWDLTVGNYDTGASFTDEDLEVVIDKAVEYVKENK